MSRTRSTCPDCGVPLFDRVSIDHYCEACYAARRDQHDNCVNCSAPTSPRELYCPDCAADWSLVASA